MKEKILLIIDVILGLLLSFGTKFIFVACTHEDGSIGKCNNSQSIIFIIGLIIAVWSLIIMFMTRSGCFDIISTDKYQWCTRIGHAINAILYVVAFLIPNFIVGVCKMEHMICRKLMLPAVNIFCVIGLVISVYSVIASLKEVG